MKNIKLFILFLLVSYLNLYSFEISSDILSTNEEEKKGVEFSGKLNDTLTYTKYNTDRYLYQHKNLLGILENQILQNSINLNLDMAYEIDDYKINIKTFSQYINNENKSFTLEEAFIRYTPNYNLTITLGKNSIYWGKGYIFNPTGIFNPEKDVDNPETQGEGKKIISFDYNKSFNSDIITNYTFTAVAGFDNSTLNEDKNIKIKDVETGLKNYFLIMDTDLEIMLGYKKEKLSEAGFGFSRNIVPEFEIHGEYAYVYDDSEVIINNELKTEKRDDYTNSYIAGFKYVLPTTTNITLEYYRNGLGRTAEEYNYFYEYLSKSVAKEAISNYQNYFNKKNNFQNYGYLKISHSEPFGILYFNVYSATILNIEDKSFSQSIGLNYAPTTNVLHEMIFNVAEGKKGSEYGDKENMNIKLATNLYF